MPHGAFACPRTQSGRRRGTPIQAEVSGRQEDCKERANGQPHDETVGLWRSGPVVDSAIREMSRERPQDVPGAGKAAAGPGADLGRDLRHQAGSGGSACRRSGAGGASPGVVSRRQPRRISVGPGTTARSFRPRTCRTLSERYYRGQTGRASGEAGTGLGLAICKETIDRHKGTIEVSSSQEAGTSFTISLPYA